MVPPFPCMWLLAACVQGCVVGIEGADAGNGGRVTDDAGYLGSGDLVAGAGAGRERVDAAGALCDDDGIANGQVMGAARRPDCGVEIRG